jgi:hypothetical protein
VTANLSLATNHFDDPDALSLGSGKRTRVATIIGSPGATHENVSKLGITATQRAIGTNTLDADEQSHAVFRLGLVLRLGLGRGLSLGRGCDRGGGRHFDLRLDIGLTLAATEKTQSATGLIVTTGSCELGDGGQLGCGGGIGAVVGRPGRVLALRAGIVLVLARLRCTVLFILLLLIWSRNRSDSRAEVDGGERRQSEHLIEATLVHAAVEPLGLSIAFAWGGVQRKRDMHLRGHGVIVELEEMQRRGRRNVLVLKRLKEKRRPLEVHQRLECRRCVQTLGVSGVSSLANVPPRSWPFRPNA